MIMNIGSWVKREGKLRRLPGPPEKWVGPKWHVVESLVADRAVVRCGKELRPTNARGQILEVSAVEPFTRMINQPQLCQAGCS